jgi:hypothetical protein
VYEANEKHRHQAMEGRCKMRSEMKQGAIIMSDIDLPQWPQIGYRKTEDRKTLIGNSMVGNVLYSAYIETVGNDELTKETIRRTIAVDISDCHAQGDG